MRNAVVQIESEPDGHGRQRFTMTWDDDGGVFRPEPSKQDGMPVGYRRGQCFNAHLQQIIGDLKNVTVIGLGGKVRP